ncbi:hypothetical protein F5883DRAFT_183693 [Diaporthe sp. PMI_573]|nr:hypothetical protein F5883DRAFT_183693 [Diaporthaceae sp. PMI_573]
MSRTRLSNILRISTIQIRTVIGINLNDMYKEQEVARKKWLYNKMKYEKGTLHSEPEPLEFLVPEAAAKSADFSVWRADKRAVKNRLFQTSYGKHKAGVKLQLYLSDFIRPADIDRICEEEGRRAQDIRWPKIEIPSEMLCGMVKMAVDSYHDTYLEDADRAWEKEKAKWIKKKEADAEAARRRHAAESEAAARRSSAPGTLGRLRDRAGILRPYWLRSPKI